MSDSISNTPKPRFVWKTATTIGAATWLVTSQLTGCATTETAEGEAGEGEEQTLSAHAMHGEGEGEGEGEEGKGGEGEGAAADGANLATDDVAYLTQLSLIRGHLAVGNALYSQGLPDLAETHMKHPRAEIYMSVEPAFAPRGCSGFARGLTALTNAVVSRQSKSRVEEIYHDLTIAIGRCEVTADVGNPAVLTQVIENLLRTGGVEYQIGVIDGKIDNLHEYQDAWGFTQVAADWARSPAYSSPSAKAVAAQIESLVMSLQSLWPSLNPGERVDGEAAQLFGAAGRTQVIALGLNR